MPTLVDVEGFEHQVVVSNATTTMNPKLWDTAAATGGLVTFVPGRNGNGIAVNYNPDGVTACRLLRSVTTPGLLFVASFYFRVLSLPSSAPMRVFHFAADIAAYIAVNTDGTICAGVGTGTRINSAINVNDGNWHLVDCRFNSSPATHTLDWTADTVGQTQATGAGTASSNTTGWGTSTNSITAGADGEFQCDDVVVSATTGDYPMGAHTVFSKVPTADGTHVAGTNIMERAGDGADINGTTVTAWDLLDEWPPTTGLSNMDSVRSAASGATNYAEVQFGARPWWAASTAWGVTAVVAHQSDTTGANTGISRIVDSAGTTLTDIFSGDMSEITDHYTRRVITAPAGGWTGTNLDGVKGRVGFGTLQPGNPEWLALMLQVATPDQAVGTNVPSLVTPRQAAGWS